MCRLPAYLPYRFHQARLAEEAEDLVGALEDRFASKQPHHHHHHARTAGGEGARADVERAKRAEAAGGVLPTAWLLGMFAGCIASVDR